MRHVRRLALLGAVALFYGTLVAGTAQAGGADRATLIVHVRLCPVGDPTHNIVAECHGTPVPAEWGVTFRVHHRTPQAPDARRNVAFRSHAAGDHLLVQATGSVLPTLRVRLWCGVPGSGVPSHEQRSHVVHLRDGVRTVCDWYFIPLGE